MGLFDNYNELEKQILEFYISEFSMMGLPDAKKMAKDMLNKAINESKEARTYFLPSNFGDIILGNEKTEHPNIEKVAEIFRKNLPQKRAEGVKNEDIRWWWNLNDVERHMMLGVDEFHRMALFINELQEGKSENQAGIDVWKAHPIYTYGDPNIEPENKPFKLEREDYPLPVELKERVNDYIIKRASDDSIKYKEEMQKSSTFNALVRKEIKAGKI